MENAGGDRMPQILITNMVHRLTASVELESISPTWSTNTSRKRSKYI